MSIIQENHAQIMDVVTMAFPKFLSDPASVEGEDCDEGTHSTLSKLECHWIPAHLATLSGVKRESTYAAFEKVHYTFLHEAQNVMSSAASSYKLSLLYAGGFVAAAACLLSARIAFQTLPNSGSSSTFFLLAISTLHGAMMFASSFVEEEQQFWYWISTSWMIYVHLKS